MNSPAVPAKNPFPGLRPFEQEESDLFFGREVHTQELLRRLDRSRFVAVVGSSGSGKSSLVRAGLLPALYGDFLQKAGSHWRIVVFRPGESPIGRTADSLHDVLSPSGSAEERRFFRGMLETTLRRGSMGLVTAVQQANLPQFENLLLVVDQFEELFRFRNPKRHPEDSDEAAAFVKLLLQGVRQDHAPIYVVITMRSDFLGDCARFLDLPEAVNAGLYLIPRLSRDQLREAILGPAAMHGARMSPGLIQRLLNDVQDDQDQLPVLQHALMRTWKGRAVIEQADYDATGGMASALHQHAEEAFEELPDSQSQAIAKLLFQSITEKGPDNREVRSPRALSEIAAIADISEEQLIQVIECFRAPGRAFLMPPHHEVLRSQTPIDISHESLIRKWQRLRGWVEEEAQSRDMCLRLADASRRYQSGEAGLWRDPELQLALSWCQEKKPTKPWVSRYTSRSEAAFAFLKESEVRRDAEAAEKEKQRQLQLQLAQERAEEQARAAKRLRRIAITLAVVTILAAGAALLAREYARLAQAGELEIRAKTKSLVAYQKDLNGDEDQAHQLWSEAEELRSQARRLRRNEHETVYLTVRSQAGARISIDGESRSKVPDKGETPPLILDPGRHTIEAVKDEFEVVTESVDLAPGKQSRLVELPSSEFTDQYLEGKRFWVAPALWKVENGKMLVRGPEIGWLRDKVYKSFKLTFALQFLNGKGATWILRAEDESNYYLFQLNGPKGDPPNAFRTFIVKSGKPSLVSSPPVQNLANSDDWFHITVEARDMIIHRLQAASQPLSGAAPIIGLLTGREFGRGRIAFTSREGEEYYLGPITIIPLDLSP